MFVRHLVLASLLAALGTPVAMAAGQKAYDPAPLIAAQREAMLPLAALDGIWRGTATRTLPSGETQTHTQTERVGPFLDGAVKVIEGRGYGADGKPTFNALAIVSFDPNKGAYNFRSYAMGHAGDFAFKPTADGFTWEIPAGPATMRYTTVIKDGVWSEIGERIEAGKPTARFIELKLKRIGDSDWPSAGTVTDN